MSSAIAHVVGNGVDINFNLTTLENTPSNVNLTKFTQETNIKFTQVIIQVNSLPSGDVRPSHSYHIHEKPVSGDCNSAGGHHDHHHGDHAAVHSHKCDSSDFKTCEIGDLSGKHGPINGTQPVVYLDRLPSVNELSHYSIVVHDSTDPTKRIACANFELRSQ